MSSLRAGAAVCLGVVSLCLAHTVPVAAQETTPAPVVTYPTSAAISSPLSSLPPASDAPTTGQRPLEIPLHALPQGQSVPGGDHASDRAAQTNAAGVLDAKAKTNFGGISSNGYIPPDPNIAVGDTYIVEMVNSEIAIYDKSGNPLPGYPKTLGNFWTALGGACGNSGDPVVQYDRLAGRWFVSQLESLKSPYGECIAVSTTNDPGGTYTLYFYNFGTNLNDYPKFGVWPTATNDAYLATYNLFANGSNFAGAALCAYNRQKMLGRDLTAEQVCTTISTSAGGFLPSDLDGPTAPLSGEPGYFLAYNASTLDSLTLYTIAPNFGVNPPTAPLGSPVEIPVDAFSPACGGGTCIPQPSTSRKLDSLGDRLMYRLAYWNFGDHQSMVVNHSITSPSGTVAPRWYQLTKSGGQFDQTSLSQSSTYAPDSAYRWMGSIAMDQSGDILLGYSRSSSTSSPSIYVAGRVPTDAPGTLSQEIVLKAGGGSQTGYNRWGDYTSMRIDPADNCTFWYVNEYLPQTSFGNWSTYIGSHQIAGCGSASSSVPDFGLTDSLASSITLPASSDPVVGTVSGSVTVSAKNGFLSTVNLSCSAPFVCAFDSSALTPTAANPNPSTNVTVSVAAGTKSGAYTPSLTGTSGNLTHAVGFALTVPVTDFTITPPSPISVNRGSQSAATPITLADAPSGTTTNSPVNLSVTGLPRGTSAVFSANPTPSNGSTPTITVKANRNAPAGTYQVTLNASDGAHSYSPTFQLTVR
jgi:hypothetical protein